MRFSLWSTSSGAISRRPQAILRHVEDHGTNPIPKSSSEYAVLVLGLFLKVTKKREISEENGPSSRLYIMI
jgi:hypothetical protein